MLKTNKIILTVREKDAVKQLSHPLYTVDYIEKWVNRNDNVFTNAPAALNAMAAKGFYEAIKIIANDESSWVLITGSTHGEFGKQWYECEKCGHKEFVDSGRYCPGCGRKIRKEGP